jgi:hypothetical protein
MSEALAFILANKYVLLIALVSFVVQYLCAAYILKNRKTDFSYSGHTVAWFEGTKRDLILSVIGFASGVSAFIVCIIYLIIKVNG